MLGRRAFGAALVLALVMGVGAGAGACGDDDANVPRANDASTDGLAVDGLAADSETTDAALTNDAGTRPFYLSSTGTQLIVSGPEIGFRLLPGNLAEDVDVITIHQEFYGVPWEAFEANIAPPAEWIAVMDRLATEAKTLGKRTYVSISPINGGRDGLANRTVIRNGIVENEGLGAQCYDFTTAPDATAKRQAFIRYAEWMADKFDPLFFTPIIEANLFQERCPAAAWTALSALSDAAYDAIKAKHPTAIVFPTFQIGHLYGYEAATCPPGKPKDECFEAAYATIANLKRDRFGISTYPFLEGLKNVADVPADWFTKGPAKKPERAVIAETGWNSSPIVVQTFDGQCVTFLNDSEADADAWLGRVLDAARTTNMDLVTWITNRDLAKTKFLADCPCTFEQDWCAVRAFVRGDAGVNDAGQDQAALADLFLKVFGGMGIRTYEGALKPAMGARWKSVQQATPIP